MSNRSCTGVVVAALLSAATFAAAQGTEPGFFRPQPDGSLSLKRPEPAAGTPQPQFLQQPAAAQAALPAPISVAPAVIAPVVVPQAVAAQGVVPQGTLPQAVIPQAVVPPIVVEAPAADHAAPPGAQQEAELDRAEREAARERERMLQSPRPVSPGYNGMTDDQNR